MKQAWQTIPLGEICAVEGGNAAPQTQDSFIGGTIPFVRMKDLGRYHFTTNLDTTDDRLTDLAVASKRMKLFDPGCILFPRSGSVFLNHRAILGVRACVVSHIGVLKQISPLVLPRFLYRYLQTFDMRRLSKKTTGVDSIAFADVKKIRVPVPSVTEQTRIVKLLDAAEDLRRLGAEADRRTADLIPAIFYEMFGDPATNPRRWEQRRLEKVGRLDRGRSRHRPRDEPSLYGGPYPFIQTGDVANSNGTITTYHQTYSEDGLAQSRMWPPKTLCITIAANIAKTAVLTFDACFPDSIVGFIPGPDAAVEYVREWFVTMEGRLEKAAPQSAQKNINLRILNGLTIPVPPLALQREFAARVAEVRALEAQQAASRQRLDDLFQSMLHRAFRGEL